MEKNIKKNVYMYIAESLAIQHNSVTQLHFKKKDNKF